MAYNSYSWGAKAAQPTPLVPLKPGPDPQHLNPTPDPRYVGETPLWADASGGVPTLPVEYTNYDGVGQVVGGGGPVDHTPLGGSWGVSTGPGLDNETAQDIREEWSGDGRYGELASHSYWAVGDSPDGQRPVTSIVPDMNPPQDGVVSPQTLALKQTGVGGTDDPYARRATKMRRVWNFIWDRHMYDVETRPMVYKTAKTAQPQPAVTGGNTQYTSPFATNPGAYADFYSSPFVAPQRRIQPEPWDNALTTDGTQDPNASQLWSVGAL